MDRNSLLQSTFEIVIWPEIQDYMTIDDFRENAILINEEPFVDMVGSSAYFVNTEWKKKQIQRLHTIMAILMQNIKYDVIDRSMKAQRCQN